LHEEIKEECAAQKRAVDEHKSFIKKIQQISATNEQLLLCFRKTEVNLQRELDAKQKLEVTQKNQQNILETSICELQNNLRAVEEKR